VSCRVMCTYSSVEVSDRLMLLLGEPGSGKSMFTWYSSQSYLQQYQEYLARMAKHSTTLSPWIPIVIDLKEHKLSEVCGLLPRYLKDSCGLSESVIRQLRCGPSLARFVVFCDGFDELKAEADERLTREVRNGFSDFAANLCGGSELVWPLHALKVVVTCRENRLNGRTEEDALFGKHRRRLLLPFRSTQITRYLEVRTGGSSSCDNAAGHHVLPVAEYLAVMKSSPSLKEMTRNPFVLRLFVEVLPTLKASGKDLGKLTRYDIYSGFVTQWFERELRRIPPGRFVAIQFTWGSLTSFAALICECTHVACMDVCMCVCTYAFKH
jgi:hypothetical protein